MDNTNDSLGCVIDDLGCGRDEFRIVGLLRAIGIRLGYGCSTTRFTIIVPTDANCSPFLIDWLASRWTRLGCSNEHLPSLRQAAKRFHLPAILRGPNAVVLLRAIIEGRSHDEIARLSQCCARSLNEAVIDALTGSELVSRQPSRECA